MSELPIERRGQGIDPSRFERDTYTQFQTWLGETKSAEGCPVNCTYCFFKLDGQTPKRPDINMSAQETVDSLASAPTYHPEMPINFGSQTDAFSTPRTIAHYTDILKTYGESDYPNPVVFITKRKIPEQFMELASDIEQPVVFYMSYSGLAGTGLEPSVKEEHLRENFLRLEEYDLPRVHYWRPFMPQNSSAEKITDMLDFVTKHANCSVINGLKLNDGILEHVAPFWPELRDREWNFQETGDVWPEGVRSYIQDYANEHHPSYPLFFDTACSLSYVLNKPDIQGAFATSLCKDSACPTSQRERCATGVTLPTEVTIQKHARHVGINPNVIDLSEGKLVIDSEVATGGLVYLRSQLRIPVVSRSVDYKGHNWASSVDADNTVVEVPWTH